MDLRQVSKCMINVNHSGSDEFSFIDILSLLRDRKGRNFFSENSFT